MGGVERQVDKKRLLGVTAYEIAGGVGKQIRAVAADPDRFGAAVHVWSATVHMRVIIDVAGSVAEKLVETSFSGATAFGKADIPFTETTRGITCLFQRLGNSNFFTPHVLVSAGYAVRAGA